MTIFIRLLSEDNKAEALHEVAATIKSGGESCVTGTEPSIFLKDHRQFRSVPGTSFAYWASGQVLDLFRTLRSLKDAGRTVRTTNPSTDDFRFARAWWEPRDEIGSRWRSWNKGGGHSPFYRDVDLVIDWDVKRSTYRGYTGTIYRPDIRPANLEFFSRPGLTWVYRGSRLCIQAMPEGTVISTRGNGIYSDPELLNLDLALLNSSAADYLVKLTLGRSGHPQFDIGDLNTLPVPEVSKEMRERMARLGYAGWSLMRSLDAINEVSHAFLLPSALRARLGNYDPPAIEAELAHIQAQIDAIAFDLYSFSETDRSAVIGASGAVSDVMAEQDGTSNDEAEDEDGVTSIDQTDGILSWALGVAFGRFDHRLATGERAVPPEPAPFDQLPAKSPGMLPDGVAPFHSHPGILVDDPGHAQDLARLVEEVLARVDAPVPSNVRRWLQRDFFPFHLRHYSRSRRKAPIYWPLSTNSGSYTLWLYYPALTNQTLYIAVNDFIEGPNGKLKQVEKELAALRIKGSASSREEEKKIEALQTLEGELIDLRDTLLQIAPTYRPNHDDGVQITAAPLWPLFRHKPWQKVLKDTWAKLEKGEYDWAHLAMNYWPDRIREKCKADKSLAIAHNLEDIYVEPEPNSAGVRGRKKKSAV
jgi:hypothetical protein